MKALAGLTARAMLGAMFGAMFGMTVAPARAEEMSPPACTAPAYLLATEARLPKVAEAVKPGGKLDILVIGSRSATVVAAPDGTGFPARMEAALRELLPSVAVSMTMQLQIKKTAADVAANLGRLLEGASPTLVIWQTGTVDAIRSIDPDDFNAALGDGVTALKKTGADVVLVNLQYGPRMETMISTTPYLDVMRVVAQEQEIPLFDRFGIMHHWNDTGRFDLFSAAHGVEMAKRVHDCLGRALARFVIDAAEAKPPQPEPTTK